MTLLHDTVQWAAALPTMYALMSLNEYATHRYFQHLEFNRAETFPDFKRVVMAATKSGEPPKLGGDGHVEHHAETYDDMSLKNDERWRRTPASKLLEDDEFRGTAFSWTATGIVSARGSNSAPVLQHAAMLTLLAICHVDSPYHCILTAALCCVARLSLSRIVQMTAQMLPSVLPTYALMGWSVPETMLWLLPSMLVHALVWNAIHPPMHGLAQVTARSGAPSHVLLDAGIADTAYFKYIFENHMGHHVLGGQANYNVCCPMADHLLGTYVPPEEWRERMRALPEGAITRGKVVGFEGMPMPPTWQEQQQAKRSRLGLDGSEEPAAVAGGGAILADAYSS